jgi:S-formylglutathione hydrolase FrmB
MPIKRATWAKGQVVEIDVDSKVLRRNYLGDPHLRKLHVWLPAEYDAKSKRRFPVIFDLVGYAGTGMSHTNWKNFGENVPERAARLVATKRMEPCILVFPDCFTAYGGNQYINSSAVGRYADYLVDELVPLIDKRFRTQASREHRGCFGKSSGGYGAIVHAMKYADTWAAVACHSGDAYFDFVYRNDFAKTLDHLARYTEPKRSAGAIDVRVLEKHVRQGVDDGRIRRFLDAFFSSRKVSAIESHVIMMLCMAASYDPDLKAPNGFRMPVNLETGEMIEKRWKAWLAHDPIVMVDDHLKALRSMRGIWIDCGWSDQYAIHYGARILSKKLAQHHIEHVYEEFDDNHSDIDYRLDASLPFLVDALKAK